MVSDEPSRGPALLAGAERARRQERTLHIASELALVVVLALTLGVSWRDGLASDDDGMVAGSLASDVVADHATGSGLNSVESFTVGSALLPAPTARPVEILIPALDVHRAVEKVGVDQFGVLNLPVNAWNAGWFEYGPVPGAPGDAVIEGHSGYPGKPLIFGMLYKLRPGDKIIVVLADRSRRLFTVVSMTTVPSGSAPPGLADPYGPPRLTLLTCTGHFDKNIYSYTSRLVLEASYAGLA